MTWEKMRINRKFQNSLRSEFGLFEFTNVDAYELYAEKHATYEKDNPREHWLQMNVRNNLCAMANEGTLIRIEPGVYRFAR